MKMFKVAKIMNSKTLYITGGQIDGIKQGDKFIIMSKTGIDIKDPDTGDVLETVPGDRKAKVYAARVFDKVTMVSPEPITATDRLVRQQLSSALLDVNPLQITGTSLNGSGSIEIGDIVLKV